MHLASTFQTSLRSLRANKARTFLTVLGIVIGIASIVIVYSAGAGINSLVQGEISSFGGSDTFETEIKVPSAKSGQSGESQSAASLAQGVQVTTLTLDDYQDILKLPNVTAGYAGIMDQELASYQGALERVTVLGETASYLDIDQSEVGYGRWYTDSEDKSLDAVTVLGSKISEKLFGDQDPLGKYIKLRKTKFLVIGVLKPRGAVMGLDFDNIIYVPLRTLQKKVMGVNYVQYMMHQVADTSIINDTTEDARYILRQNHDLPQPNNAVQSAFDTGKDDFRVVTMQESMDILETVTGAVTLLLLAIVAISLVVGGVGILNIMYVVVTERTHEIGLRKAVGARYSDIMYQFLIESVIITILGGIIGSIIGSGISYLISLGAGYAGLDWQFSIPAQAFYVAIGFSAFFGVAFGLYPARKAARMDPITALRNE